METGEIGQGGVVLRQILAGVGVAHGDQVNIHTVCFHGGAQGGQTLRNRIHAHWVKAFFPNLTLLQLPEEHPAALVCRFLL